MNLFVRKDLVNSGWRYLLCDTGRVWNRKKALNHTSGIIVTGDEVLRGQVLDTNSHFLCKNLYEMGIKVAAVSKVADDVDVISAEVQKFSDAYDYVLTTGGVGPTHDDVTYEAVAKAFNDRLFYHPELSEKVLDFFKTNDIKHPALKMAYVPSTAKLNYGFDHVTKKKTLYPNVSVKNVFMFPGVPHLCKRLFDLTKGQLFKSHGKFHSRQLYLAQNEGDLVDALNDAVKKYPNVLFGSYPNFLHSYYDVKISLESSNESSVINAFDYLRHLIPNEFHVHYDENPFTDKIYKINQHQEQFLLETINEMREFLKTKNVDDIFLYFDGGKNSTILLHFLAALYEELFPNGDRVINGIYVEVNPKINKFISNCVQNYNLNLIKLSENNFRNFATSSSYLCIVKGTRKSDPNANKIFSYFSDLPIFNPLFNWNYKDVWGIIRSLCLPYCELYDLGYTSICSRDTHPNPHLKTSGPRTDLIYYKRAFQLADETLENAQ